ncbi:MAG: serine/threonine protein kinase [Candidatus Aureabacteria bacterium]|nr:serine/threonine protein kinase [Candidatus Auribacterota bacterium]
MIRFLLIILFFLCVLVLIIISRKKNKKSFTAPATQPKKEPPQPSARLKEDLENKLNQVLKKKFTDILITSFSGFAITASAIDATTKQKVQIKTLNPEFQNDEKAKKIFTAELEAIKRIDHPNIIRILDVVSNDDISFYVSESLEGETLEDLLKREGKLPLKRALHITNEVLKALVHCHNNRIIHRDIRPSNIFINRKNTVKLINFDIVKIITGQYGEDISSTRIGGPDFGSPEQIQGLAITGKSDVFSLGVCFYYMLTNHFPFLNPLATLDATTRPENIKRYCPNLPDEIVEIISVCLEKNPEERLKSMDVWKKIHFLKLPEDTTSTKKISGS